MQGWSISFSTKMRYENYLVFKCLKTLCTTLKENLYIWESWWRLSDSVRVNGFTGSTLCPVELASQGRPGISISRSWTKGQPLGYVLETPWKLSTVLVFQEPPGSQRDSHLWVEAVGKLSLSSWSGRRHGVRNGLAEARPKLRSGRLQDKSSKSIPAGHRSVGQHGWSGVSVQIAVQDAYGGETTGRRIGCENIETW